MHRKKLSQYLHLVWATWDREPSLLPEHEKEIYRCIVNQIQKKGCKVIAINGMCDHVHLLIKFPSTVTVAEIMKQVKGVSSRLINQYLMPGDHFRWQGGYASFTVSRWDLPKIINYIKNQKQIHQEDDLDIDLEETVFSESKTSPEGDVRRKP